MSAGRQTVQLRSEQLLPAPPLVFELTDEGPLSKVAAADGILLSSVDAILNRFIWATTPKEEFIPEDEVYFGSEWHALFQGWLHSASCLVINRLRPEIWYKTYLNVLDIAALVPSVEYVLPTALVTTSISDARQFLNACPDGLVYSPLAYPLRYTIRSNQELDKLSSLLRFFPLYLTERTPGVQFKLYVIGGDVVAVSSDGIVDPSCGAYHSSRCLRLAADLGLNFCEIYLIRSMSREWICQGVDCMPQLATCGPKGREAIADKLVGYIVSADGSTSQ